jgi:methionyl-tRNA formyltransferase
VAALAPDLFITAAYGNYLPASLLQLPPFGCLNLHPSLLPRYRGAAPVQRSLEAGESTVGVSVLYSVKAMDAGPLVAQRSITLEVSEVVM